MSDREEMKVVSVGAKLAEIIITITRPNGKNVSVTAHAKHIGNGNWQTGYVNKKGRGVCKHYTGGLGKPRIFSLGEPKKKGKK